MHVKGNLRIFPLMNRMKTNVTRITLYKSYKFIYVVHSAFSLMINPLLSGFAAKVGSHASSGFKRPKQYLFWHCNDLVSKSVQG
jgi:hypothetical protein